MSFKIVKYQVIFFVRNTIEETDPSVFKMNGNGNILTYFKVPTIKQHIQFCFLTIITSVSFV